MIYTQKTYLTNKPIFFNKELFLNYQKRIRNIARNKLQYATSFITSITFVKIKPNSCKIWHN